MEITLFILILTVIGLNIAAYIDLRNRISDNIRSCNCKADNTKQIKDKFIHFRDENGLLVRRNK